MLASNGPLSPRRGAWLVGEVADSIAIAHARGVAHGLLSPENVLLDNAGSVRIIGFCVDAALHGLPPGDPHHDVVDLAGLLHATLTGRWAGVSPSAVPRVPEANGRLLRPRQVRAGVPRPLDDLCDELLNPRGQRVRDVRDLGSARGIQSFLVDFVGDDAGLGEAIAAGNPEKNETVTLPAVPEIMAKPHPDDWVPPERGTGARTRSPSRSRSRSPIRSPIRPTSCPPRPGCRSSTTRTTTSPGCAPATSRHLRRRRSSRHPSARCSPRSPPTAARPASRATPASTRVRWWPAVTSTGPSTPAAPRRQWPDPGHRGHRHPGAWPQLAATGCARRHRAGPRRRDRDRVQPRPRQDPARRRARGRVDAVDLAVGDPDAVGRAPHRAHRVRLRPAG